MTDGIDRSYWPLELISLHAYLSEKTWGADWTYLIQQLVYFQWAHDFFDNGFPLSSSNRPAEIAQWMKEHRLMGDYAVGADFDQRLLGWWKALGPSGRWDENLPESGWPSTCDEDHDTEGDMECRGGRWDWRGEAVLAADAMWSFLVQDVAVVLRKGGDAEDRSGRDKEKAATDGEEAEQAKGKGKKGKGNTKAKGRGKEKEKEQEKEPRTKQKAVKRKAAEEGEGSRPAKHATRSNPSVGGEAPPPPPPVVRPRPRPKVKAAKKGVAEDMGGVTPGDNDRTRSPAPAPVTAAPITPEKPGSSPAADPITAPPAAADASIAGAPAAPESDAAAINVTAASMDVDPPGAEIRLGREPAGVSVGSVEGEGGDLEGGDPFANDPYAGFSPEELEELLGDPEAALSDNEGSAEDD
ncbi:hypothetical protein B0H13DRAFT_2348660 [Mycena leptocephala]|nr:hypothetical protein B0H13DRAFT_2348660 [Mycena leptocephala]